MSSTIVKEGVLQKQGSLTWQPRWVTLFDDGAVTYKKGPKEQVKGAFSVISGKWMHEDRKNAFGLKIKNLFAVVSPNGISNAKTHLNRTYHFIAKDQSEITSWFEAFQFVQKKNSPELITSPKSSQDRILICGATGNIGKYLIYHLTKLNPSVLIFAGTRTPPSKSQYPNVQYIKLDMNNESSIEAAFKLGVTKAFLLTAFSNDFVKESMNFLAIAKKYKSTLEHIVKLSMTGADSPSYLLGSGHVAIEQAIRDSGIAFTILRPNSYYQNMGAFFGQSIQNGSDIYSAFGVNSKVSYVDVRDVAEVAAGVLFQSKSYGNVTLDISGPASLTHVEMAETISSVIHRKVNYVDLDATSYTNAMKGLGFPESVVSVFLNLYDEYKSGRHDLVTNVVEKVTGHKPISFAQHVKDFVYQFIPSPTTILVLGSTGNVGTPLVSELVTRPNVIVKAATRNPEKSEYFNYLGAHPVLIDYSKLNETLNLVLDSGVDKIFLIDNFTENLVKESAEIVKIVSAKKVKHVVKLSAIGTGDKSNLIGNMHQASETFWQESKIPFTVIRANSFFQNISNFFGSSIKNGGDIYSAFGTQSKVGYVDARDVASVAAQVLTNTELYVGKVIDVHGPQDLTHDEISQKISAAIGKPVKYVDISDESYLENMSKYGFPQGFIKLLLNLYHEYKAQKLMTNTKAIENVETIIGRKLIKFETFLQDFIGQFKVVPKIKVLLVGGTGNFGQKIIKEISHGFTANQLLGSKDALDLTIATRDPSTAKAKFGAQFNYVPISIEVPSSLDKALEGIDRVILISPFSEEMSTFLKAWISAIEKRKVQFLVKLGGYGSESRATPFSEWHDDAEQSISKLGIPYLIVKTMFSMTNALSQLENIRGKDQGQRTGLFTDFYSGKDTKINMADPRDVAGLITRIVLDQDPVRNFGNGRTLIVSSPEPFTAEDMVLTFATILKQTVKLVEISEGEATKYLVSTGVTEAIAKGLVSVAKFFKQGVANVKFSTIADILHRRPYSYQASYRQTLTKQ